MVARVMLSMPPEFLSRVDAIAEREHRSRSDLVREALRRYLESRYGVIEPDGDGERDPGPRGRRGGEAGEEAGERGKEGKRERGEKEARAVDTPYGM